MDLQSILTDYVKGAVTDKVAGKAGVDDSTANDVIEKAIPLLLGGLKHNAATKEGADALDTAVSKDHDGSILADILGSVGSDGAQTDGSKILGHIFGNKLPGVTDELSKASGADASQATSILTVLAPIVLGQLGKAKQEQGLDAGGLSDLLGGQQLSDKSGLLGTLNSLLDRDGDGSAVDDILGMGKTFFGKK